MSLEADYARAPFAKMINQTPGYFWYSNRNLDPRFYIPGSPDGYIVPDIMPGIKRHTLDIGWQVGARDLQIVPCECKAADSTNYSSLDLSSWREEQRQYWRDNYVDRLDYFIIAWVYADKHPAGNIFKKFSCLFAVPPEDWLSMERKANGRKKIALSPDLERVAEWKSVTLLPDWDKFRLIPAGDTYKIPETHPLYAILH